MTEPYEMVTHRWFKLAGIGKQYCVGCGLVGLNNPLTKWCIRMGCDHGYHKDYVKKVATLGR